MKYVSSQETKYHPSADKLRILHENDPIEKLRYLVNIYCFQRIIYHRNITVSNHMMRLIADSISILKEWKSTGHNEHVILQVRSSPL
jgi:hypothetical protein